MILSEIGIVCLGYDHCLVNTKLLMCDTFVLRAISYITTVLQLHCGACVACSPSPILSYGRSSYRKLCNKHFTHIADTQAKLVLSLCTHPLSM